MEMSSRWSSRLLIPNGDLVLHTWPNRLLAVKGDLNRYWNVWPNRLPVANKILEGTQNPTKQTFGNEMRFRKDLYTWPSGLPATSWGFKISISDRTDFRKQIEQQNESGVWLNRLPVTNKYSKKCLTFDQTDFWNKRKPKDTLYLTEQTSGRKQRFACSTFDQTDFWQQMETWRVSRLKWGMRTIKKY